MDRVLARHALVDITDILLSEKSVTQPKMVVWGLGTKLFGLCDTQDSFLSLGHYKMLMGSMKAFRAATVFPGTGAWFKVNVAAYRNGTITTAFDYMSKPRLYNPIVAEDVVDELFLYPRDASHIPHWMTEFVLGSCQRPLERCA